MNKKSKKRKNINLYQNLVNIKKNKFTKSKTAKVDKKAKELSKLPKNKFKRFLYYMHPLRILKFIFSKQGLFFFLKTFVVVVIIGFICLAGLFMYYRKDITTLHPEEIAKQIQTTITTYYDRNGKVLWEDKGDGNYKLVVKYEEINDFIKKATIAIEDREFYNHHGVSLTGLTRAFVNNLRGGGVQGGSTLTQQLIKQAFFAKESQDRSLKGIPRKVKEMILAIEIERMYSKDQILTMYLNESPYGGRRNGVESGAQTYFGKSAMDVSLPEAALLAAIPNQPSLYNPYNIKGHKALIARQHKVLDDMVTTGAITKDQADDAKKIAILDTIKPETGQWTNIKAPHFIIEAKKQLEKELGLKIVGAGGLKITTTLDLDAQVAAEAAVAEGFKMSASVGADNLAMGSVDVATGQIIAMVGSVDFFKPGYGQRNAATSNLEPGSSIKPIVDFAPLFMQREGMNYGPGSILRDEDIKNIYCVGAGPGCNIQNYTRMTYGNVTIRQSLASSLNRPAVKAMHIVGVDKALDVTRRLGDKSYCVGNNDAGLSAAIGGGCTLKLIEHANAFASLARGGSYRPLSYVLEVKDIHNNQLLAWKDTAPEKVIDPQAAYMVTDILSDAQSRSMVFGGASYSFGFVIPGVTTATKTGTTDNGAGRSKDSWIMSYSPKIATGVWSGNHDGSPLSNDGNHVVRRVANNYMYDVHHKVYAPQNKWLPNEKFIEPAGLKKMSFMGKYDIWPSWFNIDNVGKKEQMAFDKISKKKATDCTPSLAVVNQEVLSIVDPISKKESFYVMDGYNADETDDIHNCDDIKPIALNLKIDPISDNKYTISAVVKSGTHALKSTQILVDGVTIYDGQSSSPIKIDHTFTSNKAAIRIILTDNALYQTEKSMVGPNLVTPQSN